MIQRSRYLGLTLRSVNGGNMKRKFRGILLATAAAGLTLIVDAVVAPTWAMSLQEAVLWLSRPPSVGEVSNDRGLSTGAPSGRALYYPQVDLRAASGVEWSNNDTTHSDGNTSCCRTLGAKKGPLRSAS